MRTTVDAVDAIEIRDVGPNESIVYVTLYCGPMRDCADRTRIAITWRDDVATHAIDMTELEARRLLKALDQSIRLER